MKAIIYTKYGPPDVNGACHLIGSMRFYDAPCHTAERHRFWY